MRLAIALLLAGCATGYQARNGGGNGYEEIETAPGSYLVVYRGNGYTSVTDARTYVMRRARELCPAGFEVLTLDAIAVPGGSTYISTGPGTGFVAHASNPEASATVRCH